MTKITWLAAKLGQGTKDDVLLVREPGVHKRQFALMIEQDRVGIAKREKPSAVGDLCQCHPKIPIEVVCQMSLPLVSHSAFMAAA